MSVFLLVFFFLNCRQNVEAIMRKLCELACTLLLHFFKRHIYSKASITGSYLFGLRFSGNFLEIKSLFKGDPGKTQGEE